MQIIGFITDTTARNLMACDAWQAIAGDLTIPLHLNLCASRKRNEFWYCREILWAGKGWSGAFGIQKGVEGASGNQKLATLVKTLLFSNYVRGQEINLLVWEYPLLKFFLPAGLENKISLFPSLWIYAFNIFI